jgi:uncharacterized protein (TIGR00369 family)
MSDYSNGFVAWCGFEAFEAGLGYLNARIAIRDEHRQQDGFIHAGVMTTMADHSAGYAAYTMIPEDHRILTVEFKMNFLRPAFSDLLICRARVIKPGRKILVCDSEVYDQQKGGEKLVVKALATMISVPQAELTREA